MRLSRYQWRILNELLTPRAKLQRCYGGNYLYIPIRRGTVESLLKKGYIYRDSLTEHTYALSIEGGTEVINQDEPTNAHH